MRIGKSKLRRVRFCALAAVMPLNTAHAQEFARTAALARESVTRGFRQTSLAVLHGGGALNRDRVTAALKERVCPGCSAGEANRITDGQRSLDIAADGSAAEFQDFAVQQNARSL